MGAHPQLVLQIRVANSEGGQDMVGKRFGIHG